MITDSTLLLKLDATRTALDAQADSVRRRYDLAIKIAEAQGDEAAAAGLRNQQEQAALAFAIQKNALEQKFIALQTQRNVQELQFKELQIDLQLTKYLAELHGYEAVLPLQNAQALGQVAQALAPSIQNTINVDQQRVVDALERQNALLERALGRPQQVTIQGGGENYSPDLLGRLRRIG